ncbi:MAG: HIT family protein [Odoribacteraceae bacterium]|jgi:histidine triad (HIT) family protein|nr:HIT family protein [Odoribacteraceae bacterium]
MATIFSKIIRGEIPSHLIAEDENFYAFLDISPLHQGHTLVVPKREIDYLFDLENDELAAILPFAKKIARAIEKTIPCLRVGIAVIGLEIPHAHLHLVPLQGNNDLDFSRPKLTFTEEQMSATAAAIRANL